MNIKTEKLLTRNEIIEIWNENNAWNGVYCCPKCRDVLAKPGEKIYRCVNEHCDIEEIELSS